jgi:hypothetical protein
MDTQANNRMYLPLLSAGVAALLVSGIALASLAMSPQGFGGVFMPAASPEAVSAQAVAPAEPAARASASRCAECGVIESSRRIEAAGDFAGAVAPGRAAAASRDEIEPRPGASYAITIRLRDGSLRVITDAHPAKWRPGERVTLIGGVD